MSDFKLSEGVSDFLFNIDVNEDVYKHIEKIKDILLKAGCTNIRVTDEIGMVFDNPKGEDCILEIKQAMYIRGQAGNYNPVSTISRTSTQDGGEIHLSDVIETIVNQG